MNKFFTFLLGLALATTVVYANTAPKEPNLNEGTIYQKTDLKGMLTTPETHWSGEGVTGTPDDLGMGEFRPFENNAFSFTYYWGDPEAWGMDWYMGYTYSNCANTAYQGMNSQYTAVTGAGKTGDTYIIYYDDAMMGPGYNTYITFKDGKAHQIKGTYITNNLWTYHYITSDKPFTTANKGWMKVTAKGYNESGIEMGSLDFYLADFRAGNGYVLNDWRWFELSQLGKVSKIRLSITSSDTSAPAYCCLDGLIAVSNEDASQNGPRLNTLDLADLYMPAANSYFAATEGKEDAYGDVNTWFSFNNFKFLNRASYGFSIWSGFTYSNVTNKTTPGFTNQYAAITGAGANGKDGTSYLVGYYSEYGFKSPLITFADGASHTLAGTYITNSTYAYLSMKNGDNIAREFSKENKDWLKLTATGYDSQGNKGKTTDFYLADFRSENDAQNYIIDSWKWMDLSSLGEVSKIEFTMSSSDINGDYMNTPSYFCMDGTAYIAEEYPLPTYGEPAKTEGVVYDALNLSGMLSTPETSWVSTDNSTIDEHNFKTAFKQGAFNFNHYWANWGFSGGFTYSNITDITTTGYTNMGTSAGKGQQGDTYLISKTDEFTPAIASFEGNEEHDILGAYITNSTYAYLSMKQGDDFAKKFGGKDGRDADWFKLTAIGLDKAGNETKRTDFYLADYRFFDSTKDYILNDWKWFDLTPLGKAASVKFELTSTDNGPSGKNTPSYFCMDNMIINHVALAAIDEQKNDNIKIFYTAGALNFTGMEDYHVTITNTAGTVLYSFGIDGNKARVPFYSQKGIYLIRAEKDGNLSSYKVMIK